MRRAAAAVAPMTEGESFTELQIDTLADSRLSVLSPLRVEVHRDAEGVTVHDPESEVFGYGASEAEALEDFREAIGELFLTLDSDRNALGPALQDTLRILETRIRKTA